MLIINGKIVTWEKPNRILEKQAIYIKDGKIAEIGVEADLLARYPNEEQLDAHSQYILPGNICAHTHFYGAYARGLSIPGASPEDFPQILEKLWWSLDKSLSLEDVRYSALVCLVDAIKHGTTTLIDHHASPNAIEGSLDEISQAVMEAGVRANLCYEVTDRDGAERTKAGIEENLRFIRMAAGRNDGLLSASFGLHASLTLSEETLERCRAVTPDDMGFHIHVAEHAVDEYDSLEKCGLRVVDRLQKHGILGPKTIVVHAVHIDAREIYLLADTNTWVTHQPRSNMNNAVGISAVESMLRAGVKVCLGNDGFSNAMWEEWKTAYLVHKLWHLDPRRMSGYDIVQMAIYDNAELASLLFGAGPIGVLSPGALADLIFVDYHPYTPLTAENLPWHILFGFRDSQVTTTIAAGKTLMHNRQLLTLDEEKIAYHTRTLSRQAWERYHNQFAAGQ